MNKSRKRVLAITLGVVLLSLAAYGTVYYGSYVIDVQYVSDQSPGDLWVYTSHQTAIYANYGSEYWSQRPYVVTRGNAVNAETEEGYSVISSWVVEDGLRAYFWAMGEGTAGMASPSGAVVTCDGDTGNLEAKSAAGDVLIQSASGDVIIQLGATQQESMEQMQDTSEAEPDEPIAHPIRIR